jgi:Holliday junction resolvase RusA-like endonuclease
VLRTGAAAADAKRAPRRDAAGDRPADHAGAFGEGPVRLVILGEPASKANSRRLVVIAGRPSSIKSEKALAYERDALRQIPPMARRRFDGPVRVTMTIFYASELPDLDESLILDVLQDRYAKPKNLDRHLVQAGVYRNDRQVREKHVFHAIDKRNPRTEIVVEPMQPQQATLL